MSFVILSDVAARNCLVTGGGTVKIYDFWMTRKGEEYQLQQDQKMQLQIKWTAPETLKSGKYKHRIIQQLIKKIGRNNKGTKII